MTIHSMNLLPITLFLSVILQCAVASSAESSLVDETICLDKTDIAARLASNDRLTKRITRVTIPSTASTEFRKNMSIVQGHGDFERYKSFACEKLCFHSLSNDDPFVELEFLTYNDGHHAYDRVLQLAEEPDPYLMTTLRDPIEYVIKGYTRRSFWDAPTANIKEMTLEEWLDQVPWRANQLTRMMGRENGDERVLQGIVDPEPNEDLQTDEYMKAQNSLGADSQVLQKAWERLSKELHWFGLFHRLPESMELLGFAFCADTDKLLEAYQSPSSTRTHTDLLTLKVVGQELTESEKEEIIQEIAKRNQLDLILFERAEDLFDQRLEEMKEAKRNGILCNFAGTVQVTCADDDSHEEL